MVNKTYLLFFEKNITKLARNCNRNITNKTKGQHRYIKIVLKLDIFKLDVINKTSCGKKNRLNPNTKKRPFTLERK